MSNQQQGPADHINMRNTTNLASFAVLAHSTCFTPFLRIGFGAEALGFNGAAAFIMVLLFAGAFPDQGGMSFFWLWLGALLFQRVTSDRNRLKKKIITHSRYSGFPALTMKLFPCIKQESTARAIGEPMLLVLLGLLLYQVSEPLGAWVMSGSVSLVMVHCVSEQIDRRKLQAMHDAQIEQEYFAEQFRNGSR